jgi:hypothetical protein
MLKRTKGRLLLTLLVITGLAGALKDNTLSHKERKTAMNLMKDIRLDVLKSVKGLSAAQLRFKPAADQWSVKECVYYMTTAERMLWDQLQTAMKERSLPEKRKEIVWTDEQVIQWMEDRNTNLNFLGLSEVKSTPYKSTDEAINVFKTRRTDHIKYIKTTTEDLRNHVVQTPVGWLDCYQLCLMIGALSNRFVNQIEEIKNHPGFPKK